MNWFQCLILGLISGMTEFLPVSSEAHNVLLGRLFGVSDIGNGMRLALHLGALFAVFFQCRPQISKLVRENRIAALPARKRKRRPDSYCILDWKILKTGSVATLLGFFVYPWVGNQGSRLWILAILLIINGIILYLPQFMRGANKTAQNLSGLDAFLVGMGGALGVLPGVSRMAAITSVAQIRGCEKSYALHMGLLLSIPVLCILILFDLAGLIAFGFASDVSVIGTILAIATSFFGGYIGVHIMQFLAVKTGFSGFAYYSWGGAMLSAILYLAT